MKHWSWARSGHRSENVFLDNRLGISNERELADAEERISKAAAMQLYQDGLLNSLEPGTVSCLREIHRALFGKIYSFAGEIW